MAFFEDLTASLKQKWLQFFQANRSWLSSQMEVEYVDTPDGGKRPSSSLILGVVSALEPQLAELMVPFTKLNQDLNTLIEVLELNFDPDLFHSNSFGSPAISNEQIDAIFELPNEVEEQIVLLEDEDQSVVVMSATEIYSTADETILEEPLQNLDQPSSVTQSGLNDALEDERNQENASLESGQTDVENHPEQEKRPEDDEISRLFPNF